jgi:hypothetical protein
MDRESTGSPTVVITLVHGTWSKGEWTEPGSCFCRSLERGLAAERQVVRIERFPWPGKNTTGSRARAAYQLRWDLIHRRERYSSADHFVVGHSHGGTVALKAIEGLYVGTIAGVATLSTPFLVARPRNVGRAGWVPFWICPPLAAMLFGWYAYARWFKGLPGIAARLLAILVAGAMAAVLERVWQRLLEKAAVVRAQLSYSTMLPEPLYIARAPGDEASEALASSHLIERATTAVWFALARPLTNLYAGPYSARDAHGADRSWAATLSPNPLATMEIAIGLALILFVPRFSSFWICLIFAAVFSIAAGPFRRGGMSAFLTATLSVYAALLSALSPVLAVVLAVCTWAEYDELSMYGIALDVSAESTPPGRWELTLLPDATTELAHSVYDDPRVQNGLVQWIVRTIANRRRMKSVAEYLRERPLGQGSDARTTLLGGARQDQSRSAPDECDEAHAAAADRERLATATALTGVWGGRAAGSDRSGIGVILEVVPTGTGLDVRLGLIVDGLAHQFVGSGHDLYQTGDLSVAQSKLDSEAGANEFDVLLTVGGKDMVVSVVPIAPNVAPFSAPLEFQRNTSFADYLLRDWSQHDYF